MEYTIAHAGASEIVTRSHKAGGGQWQLLGTWEFNGNGSEYVEVSAANGTTTADAIRLVKVGDSGTGSNIITTQYLHTDHLGTPRAVSDDTQTIIWRWDSTPFGDSVPNEDPDGDSKALTLNLRFTGQYYDVESGLHYNYFRDYDPLTGRYVESDPIGLRGGNNNFVFAGNAPIRYIDPLGLFVKCSRCEDKITLELPITFFGVMAGSVYERDFIAGIENAWTGTFGKFQVTMDVVVGSENNIEIPVGPGRSFVKGNNKGVWYGRNNDLSQLLNRGRDAAHEAGHLMNLDDRYEDDPNSEYAILLDPNNIMADVNAPVDESNIREILTNNQCMRQ